MIPTYIVGSAGAAKEIFYLIKTINKVKSTFNFKGFIGLNPELKSLRLGSETFDIFDEAEFLMTQKGHCNIVFGIAFPEVLKSVIQKYKHHNHFHFPNIIHPQIELDESVTLGQGNSIAEASVFTVDISIGDFNLINRGVHLGHDVTIGSANVFNPCAVISGGVNIKNYNLIGSSATVLQYLSIASNSKIGAGSLVTKDILETMTVIGVPAKPLKK
ncbi:acetyltransferase [Winogradskyella sp.]|uniref:acetyltransferase n=1 Tax=Winogradskyella sp. TaxID=1883156 RepID=UPI003F6B4E70